MVLSKRERYVLIGTLAAVGLLAVDQLIISPLNDQRKEAQHQQESLTADLTNARTLVRHKRDLTPLWQTMIQTGLKSDSGDAASQLQNSLSTWVEQSGVKLSKLNRDQATEKAHQRIHEISVQLEGTGTQQALALLLWRIQTATIPVKITDLTVVARTPGTNDLNITLRVSTIYAPAARMAAATQPEKSGGRS